MEDELRQKFIQKYKVVDCNLGSYVLAISNTNKARKRFGKLRYASNPSLKELDEVSVKELDAVVGFCIDYELVIGVKSTRTSFGGYAIALLKKELKRILLST